MCQKSLKLLLFACALVSASSAPAGADISTPPEIAPAFRAAELSAIARIRNASQTSGGCTAVLIAPQYALTASHCARGGADGSRNPRMLTFAPESAPPHYRVPVNVTTIHPFFISGAPLSVASARHDLSLLRLAVPVPADIATPLPVASAMPGEPHAVYGYLNADDGPLHGHEGCAVQMNANGAMGSDCRTGGGMSGGAFLREEPDGWVLTGIVVAQIQNRDSPIRSLIVPLDTGDFPELAEVLDLFQSAE